MMIHRAGGRPSQFPSSEYFTGTVRFDPVVSGDDPSPVKILSVPFTSFSEYDKKGGGPAVPVWFAMSEDRPLAFFAGI